MTTPLPNHEPSPFPEENTSREWFVAPGKAIYLPVTLTNPETTTKVYQVSIRGIPTHWLETIPEKVVVLPGAQKEIALVIQPPDVPDTKTGRYPLQVAVTQADGETEQTVLEGMLTVAAYEVQGRIAILMDALHYSVAPDSTIAAHFKLINQGLEDDTFRLSVEGIPAGWVSTTTPSVSLQPGEQKAVSMMIRPVRHFQSRAGRHPFKINVESQLNPNEVASVECVLTVDAFSDFRSEIKPGSVAVGENVQLVLENLGNIPDTYLIAWASTSPNLGFEWLSNHIPENHAHLDEKGAVKVRIPPGEIMTLHFQAKLQSNTNLFGNQILPYKANITSADGAAQTHTGEVISQGLIPIWIVQVGILLLLGSMCLAAFFFTRSNFRSGQATETALALVAGSTQTAQVSASQTAGVTLTAAANMTQAAEAGQQDADGDGLTNAQETELGTDPVVADTDNDGLLDGAETVATTNPLNADSDADGLGDGDEVQRGTNPLILDTDNDLLSDGQEIQGGTDPLDPDTDADGLPDGNETPPCPDPLDPDTDGDALIDGQDLEACDANNPALTATALASIPTATPAPPGETPTTAPTVLPTGTLEPTPTSIPQLPPLVGVMAFVSTRDGNPEIYTLNLADNSVTRLTIDPSVEAQPSWSPDGSRIAFATNRDGNFEIYVMNADGTGLVNLTNSAGDDFDPAWSSDGLQIAFVSNRDGNNEIFVMNADGSAAFNATGNPADDSQPTWFVQDGLIPTIRIGFTTNRDGNQEVYSMNPSGIDPQNLSNNGLNDHSPAGYSASGLLAFTSDRDGNQEIYSMGFDGSSQVNISNAPTEEWAPAWIPGTDWVVCVTNRDGNQEIYFLNGTEQFNLSTNPADDYDPAWFIP